ncbi:extracellular solute-binding protein [Cellulomonas flavigena]|uniref:extracellular solute-binding protein n=1 Tax=Cellulomonas flavigena TaxID=1711 RepID=UPI001651121B|nr:extracellular solute-binding protein [Cellulomonas flavigena]
MPAYRGAGRSPFVLTGPWNVPTFLDAGLDVTVLPVPSAGPEPAQPFVGVQMAFIARSTPDEVSAGALLDHLADHETQTALYEATGRAPALTSAVDAISDDPVVRGFAEAGAEGAPMPAIPQMSVVWAFWGGTQIAIIGEPDGDVHDRWDAMVAGIEGAILDS